MNKAENNPGYLVSTSDLYMTAHTCMHTHTDENTHIHKHTNLHRKNITVNRSAGTWGISSGLTGESRTSSLMLEDKANVGSHCDQHPQGLD